jgi:ketosteroid isomerase-like protein
MAESSHTVLTMPSATLRAAMVGGSADDTEAAFYEALQKGDLDQIMACWAEEEDILCLHPGGARLVGPAAIRANFEALFAHGALNVRATEVQRVQALASAVHSVVEQVEVMMRDGAQTATVYATHVFHKTPQGWRMVARHVSPGQPGESESGPAAKSPERVLH